MRARQPRPSSWATTTALCALATLGGTAIAQEVREAGPRGGYKYRSVISSFDGERVFRPGDPGQLFEVDAEDPEKVLKKLKRIRGTLLGVSADGSHMVVGRKDKLEVYRVKDMRRRGSVPKDKLRKSLHFALSPDAKTIVVSQYSSRGDTLLVYSLPRGKRVKTVEFEPEENTSDPHFSPDASELAIASGRGDVVFFDTQTWAIKTRVALPKLVGADVQAHGIAYTPDGGHLAASFRVSDQARRRLATKLRGTAAIALIDVAAKKVAVHHRVPEDLGSPAKIVMAGEGDRAFVAHGGIVRLMDARTGEEITRLNAHTRFKRTYIQSMSWSLAARTLYTREYNGRVWDFSAFFAREGDDDRVVDDALAKAGCVVGDCDNGRGRLLTTSGSTYDGHFKNGVLVGVRGYIKHKDGTTLEGPFLDGRLHGKGGVHKKPGVFRYEGEFVQGKRQGRGVLKVDGKYTFEGRFWAGQRAKGQLIYANGDSWHGTVGENGLPRGKGIYKYKNGEIYKGRLIDGLPDGQGEYRHMNGDVYWGSFSQGKRQGIGRVTTKSGQVIKGWWDNGVKFKKKPARARRTAKRRARHRASSHTCGLCNGIGSVYSKSRRVRVKSYSMIFAGDKNWFRGYTHYERDTGRVEYVGGGYVPCSRCNGSGRVRY